jgi:O-antigen/teichoic acid export membrane protein
MNNFTKNTLITFLTNIFSLLFGITSSIIIARSLGPKGNGLYSLSLLLPSLIVSFGNLGVGQSSIYFLGKKQVSFKRVFQNNLILFFLFSLIGLIIGVTITLFFKSFLFPNVEKNYLLISLLLIIPNFFQSFITYIFLAINKIKEYNCVHFFQSFFFACSLFFLFLVKKVTIERILFLNFISAFGTIFLSLFFLRYFLKKIKIYKLSVDYFKKIFQYGFKIYFANFVQFFHYRADRFIINLFLNPFSVGLYSVATSISEKIWIIPNSIGFVLFPKVSQEKSKRNNKNITPIICRNSLFFIFIGLIMIIFLSEFLIIFFYSREFLLAAKLIKILSVGMFFASGWKILANDLFGKGMANLNIFINLITAILNIGLNIFFIPKYGVEGAALSSSISYTFSFLLVLLLFAKISGNKIQDIIFIKKSDLYLYMKLLKINK